VPTAVDLFAGAGGATTGLRQAGFRVTDAVELDEAAAASYALNHPAVRLQVRNIRDVPEDTLGGGVHVDLLKSCPPCQGFSTLQKGVVTDDRNDLVLDTFRFVRALRPKVVLLENVPGIARDWRFDRLTRQLRAAGYGVRHYLVNAEDFGVPQRRRRSILLAVRGRRSQDLPTSLEDTVSRESDCFQPTTAGQVFKATSQLTSVQDPLHVARRSSPIVRKRIEAIPPGGTRFDLPDELVLDCHRRLLGRSAAGPYGRIRAGSAAPTMTTRCTTPSCGSFVHPTEHRGITLREAALIQTFPPDYGFKGHYYQIERQIGNAVPVRLAKALGIVAHLFCGPQGGVR